MSVYSELEERARLIHSELKPDYTFSHDRFGGVIVDVSDMDEKLRREASRLSHNAKNWLIQIADVVKVASMEKGHSQLRIVDDPEFEEIIISIRGGFPSIPGSSVPYERALEIMNRRSGVDITLARKRMYLSGTFGDWQKPKQTISPFGSIGWKVTESKTNNKYPDEKEIKELENKLTELDKLNIAETLISIVEDEVKSVINS